MPERAMDDDGASKDRGVKATSLEPFVHQVGGHSCMLKYDERSVCKPLINREHHFYQIMPEDMRQFTPHCRGLVEVSFHKDSDGYMTLVTNNPESTNGVKTKKKSPGSCLATSSSPSSGGDTAQSDSDSDSSMNPTQGKMQSRFKLGRGGSVEVEARRGADSKSLGAQEGAPPSDTSQGHINPGPSQHSVWSIHLHKKQLSKMHKSGRDSGPHKFILLENVVSCFRLPSILDLKMGTRQHGDDASDEKRLLQTSKCESTTSGSLGVRICGMKVFRADTGGYIVVDKYYGRRLDKTGVLATLYQFLHTGYRLRLELVPVIVARLRHLHSIVATLNTFRFYSSSLLVLLEGDDIVKNSEENNGEVEDSGEGAECNAFSNRSTHQLHQGSHQSSDPSQLDKLVDVRMIDFAHVTHQGFRGDRTVHVGPDTGYLFGLENLIAMFLELEKQYGPDESTLS